MRCSICNKSGEETELFEGIVEGEIQAICAKCAELEEIPVIKKPTQDQLRTAEERKSVRERVERMSTSMKTISKEQNTTYRNLARLKFPEKKQDHPDLVENYNWAIRTARRRIKFSVSQLAEKTGISAELIESLEKGQLPKDFEKSVISLENFLKIDLLTNRAKTYSMIMPEKKQSHEEIIEEVKMKMNPKKFREKVKETITAGKFDFSKKKNIENLTLSDLADLKKEKERRSLFGDDVELED